MVHKTWLQEDAFPNMIANGYDDVHDGFTERFNWDGRPLDPGFRRTRVAGRQLYCFSHAAIGGMKCAEDIAAKGAQYLLQKSRLPNGLFVCQLNSQGGVKDATADLYDQAFALFGLAWWYRLTGDEKIADIAENSLDAIKAHMRHPSGFGYMSRLEGDVKSEQNPHMHLFEAAIYWASFSGRKSFLELADELFLLAKTKFYDSKTNTLAEYFDDSWNRVSGEVLIEPGHHFEWVWLLIRYSDLTGNKEALEIAIKLFQFASKNGFSDGSGLIVDAVDENGNLLQSDLRSWPNTEYLKSLVALKEKNITYICNFEKEINNTLQKIQKYFLKTYNNLDDYSVPRGLWVDYLKSDTMLSKSDHIPVSTFYHLVMSISELERYKAGHAAFSGLPW